MSYRAERVDDDFTPDESQSEFFWGGRSSTSNLNLTRALVWIINRRGMWLPRHLVIHARPTGRRGQDRGIPHDHEAEAGVEGDVARLLRRQRDAVAEGVGLGEGLAQAPPAHAHPLPARADDDALEPAERRRAAARAAGFVEGPIEAIVARLHL